MRPVEAIVRLSVRHPWAVLALSLLLTILGSWVSVARFAIDTDTARLISPQVPWRKAEIAIDRAFPQRTDLVLAVIDASTPEQAEDAATRLVGALLPRTDLFRSVRQPGGGDFFATNGLLFLDTPELKRTLDGLVERRDLFGLFATDPTLRGFAQLAMASVGGVQGGFIRPDDVAPAFDAFSTTFEKVGRGEPARLSWRGVMGEAGRMRSLVIARPMLDYSALQPGASAVDIMRETARSLGLTDENGIRFRLTGPVPLADEEFSTISENIEINTALTVLAIALILFLALRSPKLIGAVLVTLVAGLVVTTGLGLLLVGRFNLISVAFFALFIGLGVDFGIQFAVRYRDERHGTADIGEALVAAARGVGFSLTLAALSLIAGFLSFLPTDFIGVSELGLIAGLGMAVAALASFTLLPALIQVLRPPAETRPIETASLAAVDAWIERHRVGVLVATGLLVAAGLPALTKLRFDSNPMNLRDARVESVATYYDLTGDPNTNPNTLDVLSPNLDAAVAVAGRLSRLPEAGQIITLRSFVPDDQDAKLALIRAAATEISPSLAPADRIAVPSDTERVEALGQAAGRLRDITGDPATASPATAGIRAATRLAAALDALATGPADRRDAAERAISVDFPRLLSSLRSALGAGPVSLDSLPDDLRRDWVAEDGRARTEVFPAGDASDDAASARFVAAVRTIVPDVTGTPVTIAESGHTIVRAFAEAGLFSLVAITIILWIAMRRLWDVVLAIGPLVIAGVLTLEAAHLVKLDLNFANIIALPLMFGVGVAFHIYYLIAWRQGVADVLASSLTRAIFFSALTTGTAFGSLWASSHPGTSSMGELLAISLVFTLLAAFIVVPACLGPPKAPAQPRAHSE